jgi:hypothetical protein
MTGWSLQTTVDPLQKSGCTAAPLLKTPHRSRDGLHFSLFAMGALMQPDQAGKDILARSGYRMKAWPISAPVNSPKNTSAEISAPLDLVRARFGFSDPRVGTLL